MPGLGGNFGGGGFSARGGFPGMPGQPGGGGFGGGIAMRGMSGMPGMPSQQQSDRERELYRAQGLVAPGGQGGGNVPFLGVGTSPVPQPLGQRLRLPPGVGLVVNQVEGGTPAQQAGLQPGDILHKLNDQLLINTDQLAVLVRTFQPGEQVRLTVYRGGQPTMLNATLGQRAMPPQPGPGTPPPQAPASNFAQPGMGIAPAPYPAPPVPPTPRAVKVRPQPNFGWTPVVPPAASGTAPMALPPAPTPGPTPSVAPPVQPPEPPQPVPFYTPAAPPSALPTPAPRVFATPAAPAAPEAPMALPAPKP
jgi:hypothetical protein